MDGGELNEMTQASGRVSRLSALTLLFRFRAKAASEKGNPNSIYAAVARNLENGGNNSTAPEPAKESDPHLP